ncbi:L-serine dehydratase [Microbacterium sp. LKL04]|uniref:L-serine dehydratase n=1 Tax=Microbacterium oleivorans TaxID=273677 RepID=A0A4R5YHE1_9MICO|nr:MULTISPECIES: L-serine ammonia-lyase [Microbacterium]TDL43779.1 L-serine ammonia-lyase [Microbacterium oleivorans]SCY28606.1 L-serine dehydratase [Microbacterium sp. LKL04]
MTPSIGVFDLFTVGIGPSSSHTVGPMRAAADYVSRIDARRAARVQVDLYGSLAATGRGHGTLTAVLLGLEGLEPEEVRPAEVEERTAAIADERRVRLGGTGDVPLCEDDIVLHPLTILPGHTNGLRLQAWDADGLLLDEAVYYSTGGGFIVRDGEQAQVTTATAVPFPFETAAELLAHCDSEGLSMAEIQRRNELASRDEVEIETGILHLADVMSESVASGAAREGMLPGGLRVPRRAPAWRNRLRLDDPTGEDPALWQEWVNFVALAVNEENASGGRIVTAPTNGAAGIIPAVLHYATHYAAKGRSREAVVIPFLLTAAAIGVLYKARASISGAEVGCQGEVGSASSMAAAGLAEVLGGTPRQVENAAEIAMEHNLGLTCDPIGGLVQIPCIERNAIAAAKAINAAKMALWGDGTHRVSLDEVIVTMRETGRDMSSKYKETALGGLAVSVVEC